MPVNVWDELHIALRKKLKPYGYCGHLLSFQESKKEHLDSLIKRTAFMGESNSVLIIGPPGCGKTALLECVMDEVFKSPQVKENMIHVSLNGHIHTNDNLALEEITKQLKLKEDEDKSLGNFSEKLRLLLSTIKSGKKESKSILFVLDRFELFCSHKNQNLLYNLFDIAQSRQTPICVIGMSSHPDLLQSLENRVNSRFSHQKTLLFDEIQFKEYVDVARELLSLQSFVDAKFKTQWNKDVSNLVKNPDFLKTLQIRYNCTRSLRDLKDLLNLALMKVDCSHPALTCQDFEDALNSFCHADSQAALLQGLSVLEFSLVVAMMHLVEIYDNEPFNFEIAFNELSHFLKNKVKWPVEKPVVFKAFEHLLELELVRALSDSAHAMKRYMQVRLMVTPAEVRESLSVYQNLPASIRHWAESSITD